MDNFNCQPIGYIHSPWKEKFAVPRQPGLVSEAEGQLELIAPYNQPEAVRGLEQFSHLWIIFMFHQTMAQGWQPLVRPPRLGGNQKIGVFASRSTFRPNPIGMSLVELKRVHCENTSVILQLGSLDLVHGTPVIDIKPYLPFAEALPTAQAGYAQQAPDAEMPVCFSEKAMQQLNELSNHYPRLERFIVQVLAQDPRPAYRKQREDKHEYAASISEFTLRWRVNDQGTEVLAIDPT